ncbi:MAG: extracellular solute-binding protein [Bifidobacterium breve]
MDAINQLVSEFNDANKGKIKVEASYQGSYADVQQKFSAAVQAKSTPSILQMNDTSTGYMIDSKMTTPVYKFAEGDSDFDTADLQPVALKYYSDDNGLLSLPFAISQPVTYINNKLAQEAGLDVSNPPTTFAEVVDWANTIRRPRLRLLDEHGRLVDLEDSPPATATHRDPDRLRRQGRHRREHDLRDPARHVPEVVDMFKDVALNPGTDSIR